MRNLNPSLLCLVLYLYFQLQIIIPTIFVFSNLIFFICREVLPNLPSWTEECVTKICTIETWRVTSLSSKPCTYVIASIRPSSLAIKNKLCDLVYILHCVYKSVAKSYKVLWEWRIKEQIRVWSGDVHNCLKSCSCCIGRVVRVIVVAKCALIVRPPAIWTKLCSIYIVNVLLRTFITSRILAIIFFCRQLV